MSRDAQENGWDDDEHAKTDTQDESTEDGGWTQWQPAKGTGTPKQQRRLDLRDLTTFRGVKRLGRSKVPADLVAHTKSRAYRTLQYYQHEDSTAWQKWNSIRKRHGGRDKWLFYGCPASMVAEVLSKGIVLPYGEFYARVLGRDAIYLFEGASSAARVAFKFGVESQGFLISCRLVTGRVYRAGGAYPRATKPPRGHDTVIVPKDTDLGSGRLGSNLYATYAPNWVLLRYITQIERTK